MSVFEFDSDYLTMKRNQIKNEITSAQYKIGSTWTTASIDSATVKSDGTIEIVFTIGQTTAGQTVTEIALYAGTQKVGSKTVSISRSDLTDGVIYIQRINLIQPEEN